MSDTVIPFDRSVDLMSVHGSVRVVEHDRATGGTRECARTVWVCLGGGKGSKTPLRRLLQACEKLDLVPCSVF